MNKNFILVSDINENNNPIIVNWNSIQCFFTNNENKEQTIIYLNDGSTLRCIESMQYLINGLNDIK